MLYRTQAILFLLFIVALAACGPASTTSEPVSENPDAVPVKITLTEFAIESSVTDFKVGVPYIFIIENAGNAGHEWLVMPLGETDKTMALIAVSRDLLGSGAKATVEYTFTATAELEMSCHIGRHYQNGMVIPITVSD
jgi:uncharacterized cupredoxin-like copper-binding protein